MNDEPKEKQFDAYVTVRCSEATRAALAQRAKADKRSLSNYVRMVLEEHVEQEPAKAA